MFSFKSIGLVIGILTLILIGSSAYYPATEAQFTLDDSELFIEDPLMTASDGFSRIWLHPLENNNAWPYLPMTRTTFWLERQLWGEAPRITHWINIIFHLGTALILWLMLKQYAIRGAWCIGMIFALHPIHVQSVAWASERKNVVAGVFFLLALWGYLHFIKKGKWPWYFIALGFFLCALLSKTSTIMLPVVLIFAHLWLHSSWKLSDLLRLLPFFLLSSGKGYLRIWFEVHSFGATSSVYDFSILERMIIVGHIPFFYLKKLFFPYPLIFNYPQWQIDVGQLPLYLPVLSLLLIAGILLWKYRSWGKFLFLGLGAFFVMLFPVLGIFNNSWFQFTFVTDHWVHLPSIFVFILAVPGVFLVFENIGFKQQIRLQAMSIPFWGALFITLSFLTWNQAENYKDNQTLWAATIKANPNSWFAYQELGREYLETKQYELAIKYSNEALHRKKDLPLAYNNRGVASFNLQQYDQALKAFNHALRLTPEFAEAYRNRGLAYFNLKQYEQALLDFDQAIKLKPDHAETFKYRGLTFFLANQPLKALQDYQKSLELKPNQSEVYYNQGIAYSELGKLEDSIRSYSKALQFNPNFIKAYQGRGYAYFQQKQHRQAIQDFNQVLEHQPDATETYYYRGLNQATLQNYDRALEDYTTVIRQNPDAANAYNNRGVIFWEYLKKKELACQDWKKACDLGNCQNFMLARQNKDCP